MEALLSIEQAAQVLGISPWSVRRYIANKKIRPVRIGRRVLLEQRELWYVAASNIPKVVLSLIFDHECAS
jgi:excisionase family DNA binding protein